MSEFQYRFTRFSDETRTRIRQAQDILAEYDGQRLTARQLYYQFVARDLLANTPRNYQNLTSWLTDARYAGLVDWDAIEDRGREPDVPSEWDSVDDIIERAVRQFRLPRRATQNTYVELWVEKQALAGVLEPIARAQHVTLMVNKGYSSASAMHAAAQRMHEACGTEPLMVCSNCDSYPYELSQEKGKLTKCIACETVAPPRTDTTSSTDKNVVVLYLGDHDPSGEDMVRDIQDRLTEFGVPNLEVVKVALTMAQIQRFNPPPNPAKLTDSRAASYIAEHGNSSWELDALPPRELNGLVTRAIAAVTDQAAIDLVIAEENRQREAVRDLLEERARRR